MSDWLPVVVAVTAILPFFYVSLGCWNLRSFSRSKLEQICRDTQREDRFNSILKHHESTLMRLDYVQVLTALVAWLAVTWCCVQTFNPAARTLTSTDGLGLIPFAICAAVIILTIHALSWCISELVREKSLTNGWPVLHLMALIGLPFSFLGHWMLAVSRRISGAHAEFVDEAETLADELRSVAEEGHREGVIEDEARTMIRRVIDFSEVDVADIMTPRTEMVCVNADASLLDARQVLLVEGHSRVPVIGKTTDEVIGILHAKDLLRYLDGSVGTAVTLGDIAREPFYVPKTMGVQNLLEEFKKQRAHLAIVLDEYGGVAGLVTMEDILEELVGEIVDEFDSADEGEPFRSVNEGATDVLAKVHLDDIKEHLGIELPSDGQVDTLGGYVFSSLGRIPVAGEQFQIGNVQFTVLEADKRRLVRLRLNPLADDAVR